MTILFAASLIGGRRIIVAGLALLMAIGGVGVQADTVIVSLDAEADLTSNFIAYWSEGIAQLNLTYPGTENQPFWSTVNPEQTYNSSFDFFPNDSAMQFGELTYDDSSLVSGSGSAVITGLSLGIEIDPLDSSYVNGTWLSFTTDLESYSGNVTVADGTVTGIDLTANYATTGNFGAFPFAGSGTFTIVDDQFQVLATASNLDYQPNYDPAIEWNWTGTILAAVPDPSAGDFDLDGDVDGHDFLLWQRNPSVGNLAAWQTNYGTGVPTTSSVAVVPEPDATLLMVALFAAIGLAARWDVTF